jgi:hypothetical protein
LADTHAESLKFPVHWHQHLQSRVDDGLIGASQVIPGSVSAHYPLHHLRRDHLVSDIGEDVRVNAHVHRASVRNFIFQRAHGGDGIGAKHRRKALFG